MIASTNEPGPARIDPEGIYAEGDIRRMLQLSEQDLRRARKLGLLRFVRNGHGRIYRGQWILDWIEAAAEQGIVVGLPRSGEPRVGS